MYQLSCTSWDNYATHSILLETKADLDFYNELMVLCSYKNSRTSWGLKQYLKNLFKSIHLIFAKKLNIRFYIQSISLTRFLTFALVHSTRVCYDHL